jgi:hypothetical protein
MLFQDKFQKINCFDHRDEKTPDLPELHFNEGLETNSTFDQDKFFRNVLPDVNSTTPQQMSLIMYSYLECELKTS